MPENVVKKIEKLSDLFGENLAGWQFCPGYFLELEHGLMGTFPAILNNEKAFSDDGETVFVINKKLLRLVWDRIDHARAKITKILVLANLEFKMAFSIHGEYELEERKPLRLFSEDELVTLCEQEALFRWAPGLLGARNKYCRSTEF